MSIKKCTDAFEQWVRNLMSMNHYILLIEDNPDHVLITERVLKRIEKDCKIHVIKDGKNALSYIREQRKKLPDFMLLDINLPWTSGIDVLKACRQDEFWSQVPIWILTTRHDEKQIEQAVQLGIEGYIEKPLGKNGMDSVKKMFDLCLQE